MSFNQNALGAVCEIAMGQAPTGSTYNNEGIGYPLIAGAGDFKLGQPRAKKYTNAPTRLSSVGDIILGIRASIGEKVWSNNIYCLGRGVVGLRGGALLDNNYLWHWLTSSNSQLLSKARGATFLQVNRKDIESLQIPLPPLDEQKRIAAILDAADELRAKRRQTLVELDTLIQSTFLDMFGDPVTNPKGWNTDRFEKALEGIDSGWSPKCLAHSAEENEWGILKLGAVTYCIYNDKTHKGLPPHEEPREKIEVKKGDLLFARKNTHDLVAGSAYVWETRPKLMLPDLIFRLQLKTENTYNKIFLWQLLVNKHQKKTIQKLAGGAAGSMPNISKAKLKSVELVIPPLLLQQHFANIVEKIEAQKARCRSQLEELDTLFGSLQSKAFRGEL